MAKSAADLADQIAASAEIDSIKANQALTIATEAKISANRNYAIAQQASEEAQAAAIRADGALQDSILGKLKSQDLLNYQNSNFQGKFSGSSIDIKSNILSNRVADVSEKLNSVMDDWIDRKYKGFALDSLNDSQKIYRNKKVSAVLKAVEDANALINDLSDARLKINVLLEKAYASENIDTKTKARIFDKTNKLLNKK